jgi:DinB family protein
MTNEEKFARATEQMQRERTAFLARFEGLSQVQLDFKPARDSWSVGETAQHVGLTERVIRDNLQSLLEEASDASDRQDTLRKIGFRELPLAPRFIPAAFFRFPPFVMSLSLMSRMVPRPVQTFILANPLLKARAAPNVEPTAGMPQAELMEFLISARESTVALLEPLKSRDLSRIRWQHPLLGTHDVYGTMELLAGHERRHRTQIERVKSNARFPAS